MVRTLRQVMKGEAIPSCVEEIDSEEFPEEMRFSAEVKQHLNDIGHLITYIIEEDGKEQGFVCVSVYRKTVYLVFFVIRRSARGRGLGSAVLQVLDRKFRNKSIVLLCDESLVPFYEGNGYECTGAVLEYRGRRQLEMNNGEYYPYDIREISNRFAGY